MHEILFWYVDTELKLNSKLNAISWDEWVVASRLLKFTEENVRKQKDLTKDNQAQERSARSRLSQKPSKTGTVQWHTISWSTSQALLVIHMMYALIVVTVTIVFYDNICSNLWFVDVKPEKEDAKNQGFSVN